MTEPQKEAVHTGARVDAHHHVWDLGVREQPWTESLPKLRRSFGFDELKPHLAEAGVASTVLVQTVCVAEETPELLALAFAEPTIGGVVGWVDLTDVDVASNVARLQARAGGSSLVGLRHQVQEEPDPRWLCRPDVRRGLAAVGDAGLAFDLLVQPHQLPAAIETVRALPGLRFVLDHAAKPEIHRGQLDAWCTDMARLAACPNVAVKLSGLVTEAGPAWTAEQLRPYVECVLRNFGAQRVMWGSDWPVCLLVATYAEVLEAAVTLTSPLSLPERDAVFAGTARQWYGLTA